ncbi:cell wall-binding protein [Clostridium perfringens]|uniref:Cell wall-binding protein n=1 Tax=Clostridium perfringens TaxID=1502 RepID=A0A127EFI4_CLOPF|nr:MULTISPECIES: cell wall-binding protein [Clostridium]AMN34709.1 cell wall-binding protein [Clostridium perfringens]MDK7590364.1 cell wall-binding protein [Clostridium sp. UMB9555B]MDK7628589.1 cell wall-binding protein [Clostridium sp. UMB9555A]HAT4124663.1 cell wall-binding protein [Clostridium perfringens]
MKKVREKVAIAVAIASITTISSFVISNGKKVYAEEVRVTATANVDNIKDNGKQLKNESPKANTQEDTNVKNEDLKTDEKKDIKEVESNFVKNAENKTEKINEDKSLENNNNKVSTKLESSDKDVKEIKNDKDSKDKDSKEVKDENIEKVHNNKKDILEEVENKSNKNNEDKINRDKKVEVKSEDNETSKRDEESKKIEVENKESESKLDKNQALKSDYININESGQALTVGTESQKNSVIDENKKDGWQTIGGKTYYFENGKVSTGKKEVYDTKNGEYKTYFFNEDGALVTDTGIHDYCESWGGKRKVYVNNKGEVENGWKTIDGKTYYFDQYNGMLTNVHEIDNGDKKEAYLFDNDGVLRKGTGLKEIDGKWYYFNRDNSLETGWKVIDGKTYYFDTYSGRAKGSIRIYDSNHEKYKVYLFNEDGALITEPGIHTYHENWGGERKIYVNNKGEVQSGWQIIDGKTYYFDESNGMVTWVHEINENDKNKSYLFDKDGVLVKGSGWKEINGNWYYLNNDNSLLEGWKTIDDRTYYLDKYNGMVNGVYEVNSGDKKETYLFNKDGSLVKGNGLKEVNGTWYYFNSDNSLENGWKIIDGKTYYFNKYDGRSRGCVRVYDDLNHEKYKVYFFNEDGVLITEPGIHTYHETWGGERKICINNKGEVQSGWQIIDGKTYYFDEHNGMAKGVSCISNGDNYEVYLFNEDGSLVTGNGWKEIDGKWYYFNNNNSLANGWKTINGKTYYFSSHMSIGPTLIQGNRPEKLDLYYFGEDGELINRKGWSKLNDDWFYFNDDSSLKTKWQTIGGKTYYFNETTGAMATGQRKINYDGEIYCFTSDGSLLKGKGWFSKYDEYNNYKKVWCYIDENGVLKTGYQTINGKDYYFDYDGKMVTGVVNIGGVIGEPNFYCFDNNGALFKKEGWKKINEKWYYLNEDGSLVNGWKNSGSDWYYLNYHHGMVSGPTKVIDNKKLDYDVYYFEEDGRLTNITGWINHINGEFSDWYYVENGGKAALGWNKINGTWYYFNSDAKMVTAPTRIFDKDSSKDKIYFFDKNGAYRRYSGWYELKPVDGEPCWYYFGEDGLAKTGWQTINGNKYWFAPNGIMCKGTSTIFENEVEDGCYKVDLPTYLFNESGALVTSEGWHKVTLYDEDKWCYIDNTGVCKKGLAKINNKYYYFEPHAALMETGVISIYGFNGNKEANYFFDDSGALNTSKGWHKCKDRYNSYYIWCYIDDNGELAEGFKEINGNKYYFKNGVMSTGNTQIEGNQYYFNESGLIAKGWSQNKDGEYYYTDNNGIIQKGWQKINGIWYYFNDGGVMATGPKYMFDENTYDTKLYYFDNSGALQYKKGWVNHIGKYNNDWYYINSNNELSTSWQNINGTWYYFYENGKMAKGSTAVTYSNGDKRYYCFDNSGAWVTNPGWHSWQDEFNNTCWAYINNDGSLAEGWKEINNKWYYFYKENKVMAKGAVKEWDYKTNKPYIQHFFNEDGSWDASEGWKSFKNLEYSPDLQWAYVESNGRLASGWKMIGGQWYYFDEGNGFMVTEKRDINGKFYEFNSNGTLKN